MSSELATDPVAVSTPLPVFGASDMAHAIQAYHDLQATLDKGLPDSIMEIQGRQFRKKAYWRAVKVAFNLRVECEVERRITVGEDWGYEVTYRASTPNGSTADGDGSCMASEKRVYVKDWDAWTRGGRRGRPRTILDAAGHPVIDEAKTAETATVHNVRSHAHTRAFNRAVSNLVGFGEVSAEEVREVDEPAPRPAASKEAALYATAWRTMEEATSLKAHSEFCDQLPILFPNGVPADLVTKKREVATDLTCKIVKDLLAKNAGGGDWQRLDGFIGKFDFTDQQREELRGYIAAEREKIPPAVAT